VLLGNAFDIIAKIGCAEGSYGMSGETKGPIYKKSYAFAIRIVRLSQYLQKEKKE
jgi:hypothetical protein